MPTAGRIKLLFFGLVRDVLGVRQLDFEIESAAVSDMLSSLQRVYPQLENSKLLVAVNEEYAVGDTVLRDGDEVAIFTPVSGG